MAIQQRFGAQSTGTVRFEGVPPYVLRALDMTRSAFSWLVFTKHRLPLEVPLDRRVMAYSVVAAGLLIDVDRDASTVDATVGDLSHMVTMSNRQVDAMWTDWGPTPRTLAQWRDAICQIGTFDIDLAPGSLWQPGPASEGYAVKAQSWKTRLEMLEEVCDRFGVTWNVRLSRPVYAPYPTAVAPMLDIGSIDTIFPAPAGVVITPDLEAHSGLDGLRIISGTVKASTNMMDWADGVYAWDSSDAPVATGAAVAASAPYARWSGGTLSRFRGTSSRPEGTVAEREAALDAAATSELAAWNTPPVAYTVDVDQAQAAVVDLGDRVLVQDRRAGVVDFTAPRVIGGDVIAPVAMRVIERTFGFRPEMGCYLWSSAGTLWPVTDLTDWCVVEDTQLTVSPVIRPRPSARRDLRVT